MLQVPAYDDETVSDAFRAAISPQLVIVPDAASPGTVGRGALVYHTATDGTLHIATDGAQWWVWPTR